MLKKAITFDDIDGNEVTEDFYFSYTMAELAEMQMTTGGGMESHLKQIIASNDPNVIMTEFKKIIGGAVGERTAEGKFTKNKRTSEEFLSSDAYSSLFMGFMNEPNSIIDFIKGIVPKKLSEAAEAAEKASGTTVVELPNSGIITDAQAQAFKPQPQFQEPTPFPQSLEAIVQANNSPVANSDDPAWLKEMRQPTRHEMIKMSKEELQLAFKMKEAGVLS